MKVLVIGGSRYFGKHLVEELLKKKAEVTLLTRGRHKDDFGDLVGRLRADRGNAHEMAAVTQGLKWDVIYDQVCFDSWDARIACEVFADKTKRYVFTSSQSVYAYGASILEEEFDPSEYEFTKIASKETPSEYGEGKKQAETVFAQEAPFQTVMVRVPIVLGLDDPTGRLKWHLMKIKKGELLYFPNLAAQLSFIDSNEAGRVIMEIGVLSSEGPVNISSPNSVSMGELMKWIGDAKSLPVNITSDSNEGDPAPFGVGDDWYMNVDR
ncbi:MAG: NAD-dependent epimerase/dehydratase family protein, partial [Pseudobdellovibrionaceae bacterium]